MTLPQSVGVYGGGRMGAGIAHAFLVAGTDVVVVENDDESAAAARDRVAASLAKARERGVETVADLSVTTDPAALADVRLVVEAVPELPDLKTHVLAIIEQAAPDAYVASNTSSLSIGGLAASLARPERFIGLHFFNPVPASDLVEVVVGPDTDAALVTLAQAGSADSERPRSPSRTRPASPAAGSGSPSHSRRCGWWRRGSRPWRTSTPR